MYKNIQKFLDWGVKIASLAITAPATWVVATELFADIQNPLLLFVMRFAAVFLIEGVLLSNWLLLEFDKSATPEIKARYGITALVMYVALAVIGWRHEGPTGIVFRIALLAALLGSGWDTYVYTWQRYAFKIDQSVENSGKVRRHARRLSIREAINARENEHALVTLQQRSDMTSQQELIKARHHATLESTGLFGQRLITQAQLEDREQRIQLAEYEERLNNWATTGSLPQPTNGSGNGAGSNGSSIVGKKNRPELPAQSPPPFGIHPEPAGVTGPTSAESPSRASEEDQQLILSILDAFADDNFITRKQLADKLGIPIGKVGVIVRELVEDGMLIKEGRAHIPVEQVEERAGTRRPIRARRS